MRAGDGWLLFSWHRKQVTYVLQTDDCCLPGTENRQTRPPVRAGYKWLLFTWHRKQVTYVLEMDDYCLPGTEIGKLGPLACWI